MKRPLAAIAAVAGAALAPFAACSDSTSAGSPDADAASDVATDERQSERDSYVEPSDTGPQFNADGWIRLDYPNCNFYAAPSPEKMPPPLVWEPCSSIVAPLGIDCRQIKFNWQPPTNGGTTSIGGMSGWVDAAGKSWLAVGFTPADLAVYVVAEADGPVHQAISYKRGQCSITRARIDTTKAIFTVVRPHSKTSPEERGAIGSDVNEVPRVLEHWADGAGRSYYAGPASYFALGAGNEVRAWTPGAPPLGTVVLTDPGQMLPFRFVGNELFYQVGDQYYGRIKVFSPASGARDLVSFGNDVSSRAVNFGTDGIDMVWVEAFGRSSINDPWTTINIMTAKFTADADKIQKRRLRSEISAVGVAPFTVGCGYAAHFVSSLAEGNIVRIVRLNDGHSWKLPAIPTDGGAWTFQDPPAITCEEIFVNVNDRGQFNTARIRLDSLGPGEPAD